MLDVGTVIRQDGQLYVIVERLQKSVIAFPCIQCEEDYRIDMDTQVEWTMDEIEHNVMDSVGSVSLRDLELAKRKLIFDKYEDFYQLFHRKTKSFIPGQSNISYSGRVYDQKEMIALADASLDFWLTSGRFAEQFERDLAQFLGVRYAVLTNSGSSANLLAVSALTSPKLGNRRLQPGDEVITVAAGFPTTVAPIVQNRLVPVFVDVELGTYNIDASLVEKAISPRTRAIMIAHTMGNPFDLASIMDIAKQHDLWVIEDNCDALGSRYQGKLTGTFGHIGTSSFYPPHHITMGEGGAVYTNNSLLKVSIESFRDWGRDCWCASGCDNTCKKRYGWGLGQLPFGYDHKYTYSHLGYNLKVTDMQASIGLEQLKKLPYFTERRIHNFNYLRERLSCLQDDLVLPEATPQSQPSWFGFILTVKDSQKIARTKITEYLERNKIQTRMLFAGNITKQPAFEGVEYRLGSELVNTDKVMMDSFLVGVYPGLTNEMLNFMADKIIEAVDYARIV